MFSTFKSFLCYLDVLSFMLAEINIIANRYYYLFILFMECDNELHGKINGIVQGYSQEQHKCLSFQVHLFISYPADY